MKQRLFVCLASLLGAFGIYCSQAAITSSGTGSASSGSGGPGGPGGPGSPGSPGGPVPDAHADTPGCCAPAAPVFTKLGEGDVTLNGTTFIVDTPPIDVSAFHQVTVLESMTSENTAGDQVGCGGHGPTALESRPLFRMDPSAPFARSGQLLDVNELTGGVVRVDAPTMQLHYEYRGYGADSCIFHFVVVGVK